MSHRPSYCWSFAAVAIVVAGVLAWPAPGVGQLGGLLSTTTSTTTGTTAIVTGQAQAVRATVLGSTSVLADTGPLGGTTDARDADLLTGSVPNLLGAEVLQAVTIGWPDQVASEASLANLGINLLGTGIAADFVMAQALSVTGAAGGGSSIIDNLSVNGVPIFVTGLPNQMVSIPGGQLVINEQTVSSAGTTVNALHATVFGVADVVIASATAGIQ